jgi:NADH dehydrogenase
MQFLRKFSGLIGRPKDRERVVVLGSGWAGYNVARQLDPKKYQTVLVSPRPYFAFTPLLASTAVGTLEFRTALEPVRSRRSDVGYFQGWADHVDFTNKTITIEEAVDDPNFGLSPIAEHTAPSKAQREEHRKEQTQKGRVFDLTYDKLIVGVGCYSQTFGTPGVKEHAFFLKDIGDARNIRNRMLACFEAAALPTTTEEMRRILLNFAVVGGGPTGIEFSAELHDIIIEDLARFYPELIPLHKITVYDVAEKVLPMFDKKLASYAMKVFTREGIDIKTKHHVELLREGPPKEAVEKGKVIDEQHICYTLKVKEEGEVGVGMVVWSTGLMMNPFVANGLSAVEKPSEASAKFLTSTAKDAPSGQWSVKKAPRTGAIMTDDRLRVKLETEGNGEEKPEAVLQDVYAIGDCAAIEGTMYPATAQVANQKAEWLAKRLNRNDFDKAGFTWKNMGVMAYIGNWNALFQGGGGGNISGRAAWIIWRGAYLTKSVSIRNRILIPIYWFINWIFGRDITRF